MVTFDVRDVLRVLRRWFDKVNQFPHGVPLNKYNKIGCILCKMFHGIM